MLGHSVTYTRATDLRNFEQKLGKEAELGVSFQLIDLNGIKLLEDGYRPDMTLPMCATSHIAIALTVLIYCYAPDNVIKLDQAVSIIQDDLCPGPLQNPLDKLYFDHASSKQETTKTIEELLRDMMVHNDNTAADRLLEVIGGVTVVNETVHAYDCYTLNLSRKSRDILQSVFELTLDQSIETHETWKKNMSESLSTLRLAAESKTYEAAQDACSPSDMSTLLNLLVRSSSGGRKSQLNKPAFVLLDLMSKRTANTTILKDTLVKRGDIESIAQCSGTLGGVTSFAAIIKFIDGQHAVITVYTAFSDADLTVREKVIADIAFKLAKQYKPIVRHDRQYSVSF